MTHSKNIFFFDSFLFKICAARNWGVECSSIRLERSLEVNRSFRFGKTSTVGCFTFFRSPSEIKQSKSTHEQNENINKRQNPNPLGRDTDDIEENYRKKNIRKTKRKIKIKLVFETRRYWRSFGCFLFFLSFLFFWNFSSSQMTFSVSCNSLSILTQRRITAEKKSVRHSN